MDEKHKPRMRRLINQSAIAVAVLAVLQTVFIGTVFGWTHWGTALVPAAAIVAIPFGRWFLLRLFRV